MSACTQPSGTKDGVQKTAQLIKDRIECVGVSVGESKQRAGEEVGGTVGLVANGYGAAGNEVCRQKTWYDGTLKASSSGRRWGGSVDAVERAVGVCRLSVWVV